ncbi:hypothetical protein PS15m_006474 [Mucor circinelloides]
MFTHIGTTFSSRIEGAHTVLKRHLTSSTGDLKIVFDKMDTVLTRQHTEIMLRRQQQFYKQKNQIRAHLFNGLMKTITRHALQMAFKKYGAARLDMLVISNMVVKSHTQGLRLFLTTFGPYYDKKYINALSLEQTKAMYRLIYEDA